MDLLKRTENAAHLIQKRIRTWHKLSKVIDDVMALRQYDEDGNLIILDQERPLDKKKDGDGDDDKENVEDDDEEEKEERDWGRIYTLIVVACFGIGMFFQKCIMQCFSKLGGDGDAKDDVEDAARDVARIAMDVGQTQGGGGGGGAGFGGGVGGGGGAGGGGAAPPPPPPP